MENILLQIFYGKIPGINQYSGYDWTLLGGLLFRTGPQECPSIRAWPYQGSWPSKWGEGVCVSGGWIPGRQPPERGCPAREETDMEPIVFPAEGERGEPWVNVQCGYDAWSENYWEKIIERWDMSGDWLSKTPFLRIPTTPNIPGNST